MIRNVNHYDLSAFRDGNGEDSSAMSSYDEPKESLTAEYPVQALTLPPSGADLVSDTHFCFWSLGLCCTYQRHSEGFFTFSPKYKGVYGNQ